MKIVIVGCNNDKCRWFNKGQCDLPETVLSAHSSYEMVRNFDYDHKEGRIICRNCQEE